MLTREWIKVEIISLLTRSKNYSLQLFQNLFRQKILQEDNKVAAFHFQTKKKNLYRFHTKHLHVGKSEVETTKSSHLSLSTLQLTTKNPKE